MASGSEDYWMTQTRLIGNLLDQIYASLTAGGDLMTLLDLLDGKFDGTLDLDGLDTDITILLANLLGIETSVETGGDLITKLDNLDGKADGKLDLNALKTMDIFYDDGESKSRLELTIDKLTATVTNLATIITSLATINTTAAANRYANWGKVGSGYRTVSDDATSRSVTVRAHSNNSQNITGQPEGGPNVNVAAGSSYTWYGVTGYFRVFANTLQYYQAEEST